MKPKRRSFLKKALSTGALVAASSVVAKAGEEKESNGVVVGKSNKKEILYHKTQAWEKFYKVAY